MPYVFVVKCMYKNVIDKYYIGLKNKTIKSNIKQEFEKLNTIEWLKGYNDIELIYWSEDKLEDVVKRYNNLENVRWEDSIIDKDIKEEINKLKKEKSIINKQIKELKQKTKREPTAYNIFISEELPKYKELHPEIDHKTCFKKVVELWNASKK